MSNLSTGQIDFNHWLYRFLALLIDSIVTAIPGYLIYWVISGLLWPVPFGWAGWGWWAPWWATYLLMPLIIGLIMVLYFAVLDTSWSATIGKRVLGLQVNMVNGGKVTFNAAFMRNISKIYGLFLLLDWIIGLATPGPDRRQKYTDRIAGTTVAKVNQAFGSATQPPPPPPPS